MPSKCRTCNQVRSTPCNEAGKKCVIVKCATIHYLSTNGTGLLIGTSRRAGIIIEQDGEKDVKRTKVEHIELRRVCAATTRMEQSTFYKPLITCPDCLAWIAANEPAPLDSLSESVTKSLTDSELEAMNEVNSGIDKAVLNI